jgi:hypothetical protein
MRNDDFGINFFLDASPWHVRAKYEVRGAIRHAARKGVMAIAPYDNTGKISFILYYLPVLHYS